MKHLGQTIALEGLRKLLLGEGVREHELDAREAVGAGGREAIQEVVLVVEHGEIGAEPGHVRLPLSLLHDRGRSVSWRRAPAEQACVVECVFSRKVGASRTAAAALSWLL